MNITPERLAMIARMLDERSAYYQEEYKLHHRESDCAKEIAYTSALMMLLYAEQENDEVLKQFDYFGRKD